MTPAGRFVRSLGDHGQPRWSPDGTLLSTGDGAVIDPNGDLVATVPAGEASWQPLRSGG
jgi:hypothetical protein